MRVHQPRHPFTHILHQVCKTTTTTTKNTQALQQRATETEQSCGNRQQQQRVVRLECVLYAMMRIALARASCKATVCVVMLMLLNASQKYARQNERTRRRYGVIWHRKRESPNDSSWLAAGTEAKPTKLRIVVAEGNIEQAAILFVLCAWLRFSTSFYYRLSRSSRLLSHRLKQSFE